MDVSLAMPDIASLSTIMSRNNVMSDVGSALLAQSLDTAQTNSDALTKMMELSVDPSIGGNFDMSV